MQRLNADRPEHRLNLGNLCLQQWRFGQAEAEFAARTLDPKFAPVYGSLSSSTRNRAVDADGERLLRETTRLPDAAELQHALGLNLIRRRRASEALPALTRAVALDPPAARYAYATPTPSPSTRRSARRRPFGRWRPVTRVIPPTATHSWHWSRSTATPAAPTPPAPKRLAAIDAAAQALLERER